MPQSRFRVQVENCLTRQPSFLLSMAVFLLLSAVSASLVPEMRRGSDPLTDGSSLLGRGLLKSCVDGQKMNRPGLAPTPTSCPLLALGRTFPRLPSVPQSLSVGVEVKPLTGRGTSAVREPVLRLGPPSFQVEEWGTWPADCASLPWPGGSPGPSSAPAGSL